MGREDDSAPVVEADNDEMLGVELDPRDEAKVIADGEPEEAADATDNEPLAVTADGSKPVEEPLVVAAQEPEAALAPPESPKVVDENRRREWDKERQRAQERAAKAEKAMIETNEKVARLMGEIEGLKVALVNPRNATPEAQAELKDELDDILEEVEGAGDFEKDSPQAKAFRMLSQGLKTLRAENATIRKTTEELGKTNAQLVAREQQVANKAALEDMKTAALAGDRYRNSWEILRNPLGARLPDALRRYGWSPDKLPPPETLQSIIDAELRDLKLEHLTGKAAQAGAPKPGAAAGAPKAVATVPAPQPQPRRAMSLSEKMGNVRKGLWRTKK